MIETQSTAGESTRAHLLGKSRWSYARLRLIIYLQRLAGAQRIFIRNRLAVVGIVLIAIFGLMAIAHPILLNTVWPARLYDVNTGFDPSLLHPSPPSATHLLGTDVVGRDVMSMLLASAGPAFILGLTAAITMAVVSIVMGAIPAYYGGVVDIVFTHIADAFLLLPAPLLMVILGARFSQDLGPFQFGLIYGLVSGIGGAAIVMRSQAATLMVRPYIEAARIAGAGARHILRTHLVPGMLPLVAVYMMVTVTGAIVADGFVSFFGLTRGYMNWGSMIYSGFAFRLAVNSTIPWHLLIPPGLALSLFAAAFYFVSRGLHEVAEPRLRKR